MTKRFCCCCTNVEAARILAILLMIFRLVYIFTKITYINELSDEIKKFENPTYKINGDITTDTESDLQSTRTTNYAIGNFYDS